MKRFLSVLLIAAAGMAALAAPAMAQPGHDGGKHMGHDGPRHMMRLFKGLDLSDTQQSQIGDILESNKAQSKALRKRSHVLHKQMSELDPSAAGYDTAVQTLADRAGDLKRDQVLHRSEVQRQIAEILTPEQRTEIKAKMASKREQMRERTEHERSKRGS